MHRILIVFRKELTDSLRDRRTMSSALLYPLLGPVLMLIMYSVIARTFSDQIDKPLDLPVAGAENAPSLIQFLEQNGAAIKPAPADPEAAVRAGDADVVLVIPSGYADDFTAGRPATVQLILDDSRSSANATILRAERLLRGYSEQIGALRLLARGINPSVDTALAIEHRDVSTSQSQAAGYLVSLAYFIIIAVFSGGSGIVIDTTVGERERGSLEPLLTNPVARSELVLGKLGVALIFATTAMAESLIGFAVMLAYVPLESLGVRASLSLAPLLGAFLITLPLSLVASALQMTIATFTRNFKEAQNYLNFLPLIPALPGMFIAFTPFKPELWAMLIPTFGQTLLINQLMRGEAVNAVHVVGSVGVSLLLGLALVGVAIKLYEREQIVISR